MAWSVRSLSTDRRSLRRSARGGQTSEGEPMGDRLRIALYARVSKGIYQNPENQLLELRRWAQQAGVEVEGEYVDEISSRDTRPQKEAILKKLRLGVIDGVAFYALDRWGRDMAELINDFNEARLRGWQLISLKEGLRFDTAAGMLYANILAAFANFERERIRERTYAGLARARAQGKKLGRPKGAKDRRPRRRRKNPPL
jgi:DNA invertase Pin-like site-specific DNA recombinase